MPYYDFVCDGCGQSFELHLPIERRDEASCPACGDARVRRTMPRVYSIVRTGAREPAPACPAGDDCCGGGDGNGGCACGCAGPDW
jgi:putative FmdB family regulatory protein